MLGPETLPLDSGSLIRNPWQLQTHETIHTSLSTNEIRFDYSDLQS